MTVDKIIPCVCIEHIPTVSDSAHYGMPELRLCQGAFKHRQFYTPYCPKCGRGGCSEHTSPYLALKHWNQMMIGLWKNPTNQIRLLGMKEEYIRQQAELDKYIGGPAEPSDPIEGYMYSSLDLFEECWTERKEKE